MLEKMGAYYEQARVVRDGNLITAGGVTSGIDFSLEVIAAVAGEQVARTVQLSLEYDAAPPFDGGTPATSPGDITQFLRDRVYGESARQMEEAIEALS